MKSGLRELFKQKQNIVCGAISSIGWILPKRKVCPLFVRRIVEGADSP